MMKISIMILLGLGCGLLYSEKENQINVKTFPGAMVFIEGPGITVHISNNQLASSSPGTSFMPQNMPQFQDPEQFSEVPRLTRGSNRLKGIHDDGPSWWGRLRERVDESAPQWRITISEKTQSIRDYIRKNWLELTGKALAAGYVYINYVMFRLVTFLLSPERWIYWKNNIPLEKLVSLSSSEIIEEMVTLVRSRTKKGQEGRPPLLCILEELEAERAALERYQRWTSRIYFVDDMQHHCVGLCEGCMPRLIGAPLGAVLRCTVRYCGARKLIYSDDDLMQSSNEYLSRIEHLKMVITGSLNAHSHKP